jgi:hypothetical protein
MSDPVEQKRNFRKPCALVALLLGIVSGVIMLLFCVLSFWLPGFWTSRNYDHIPGSLAMEPAIYALEGLNTAYDDFNVFAVPDPLQMDALLVFAGNAATQGDRFSIETGRLRIVQEPYSRRMGSPPPPEISSERSGPFALIPASGHNHLGPSALLPDERMVEDAYAWEQGGVLGNSGVWMYDSDQDGRRNLYFVDGTGQARPFFGNDPEADDAYVAYDYRRHELYFSSNRSGRFQIYRYPNLHQNVRFDEWLGDLSLAEKIEPAAEFASEGNSLAPFVIENMLVFASDRPGGFGGYDLYLSRYTRDEVWSEPANMQALVPDGVLLNTPANEFRPSLLVFPRGAYHGGDSHRVLLFSSDRPGGRGGYDLYLTALP